MNLDLVSPPDGPTWRALCAADVVPGWMGITELRWLYAQAISRRCIVEVGTFHGRSAMALYQGHATRRRDGLGPARLHCVDVWNWTDHQLTPHKDIWRSFNDYHRTGLVSGEVLAWRGDSGAMADAMLKSGVRADMVFIDGDHSLPAVRRDIANAYRLLGGEGLGGLLCGHDYNAEAYPDVVRAVTELVPGAEQPTQGRGWIWAKIV